MKTPKIARAMEYIDDELILAAEKKTSRKPARGFIRWAAMAAAVVLVVSGVVGTAFIRGGAVEAVIALDVNPSLELRIGKDQKVIDAEALNKDAEIVLNGMDLERVDLNVAVNAIVGSMLRHGYLSVDRNSILVSVDSGDLAKAEALRSAITESINGMLRSVNIEPSVITQSFSKDDDAARKAEENHISVAKAALIEKVIESGLSDSDGVRYTYSAIADLSISDLSIILDSKKAEIEGIKTSGTVHSTAYIGKDKAVAVALAHAGITDSVYFDHEIDMDFEDGVMVYNVEFDTAEYEYDYEINALTGEVVKAEKERQDSYTAPDHGGTRPDKDTGTADTAEAADTMPNVKYIGNDKAIEAALAHAGITASVYFDMDIDMDIEDGVMVYNVEFDTADFEYDYEINALTGEVISFEREAQDDHD